jgi:hypothetical protein
MAAGDLTATQGNYSDYDCNVFDGVDDYVEIPHHASQLGANLSNGFTISAWINPKSAGKNNAGNILDKSTAANGTDGFVLRTDTNLTLVMGIAGNSTNRSAPNSIVLGTWQHILVTVDSASLISYYKNGELLTSATNGLIAGITTTNKPNIGCESVTSSFVWDGAIRSVKMWNRFLSTTEIAQDYAGKIVSDGLIHHFKLGGDYADYGSVGVTATNSGSVEAMIEDQVAAAVKAQRVITTLSGVNLIDVMDNGQVLSVGIMEDV